MPGAPTKQEDPPFQSEKARLLSESLPHPVVHPCTVPATSRKRKRAAFPLVVLDVFVITGSLLGAYYLRFQSGLWSDYLYWPADYYLRAVPFVLLTFLTMFSLFGLYETRRSYSFLQILVETLKPVLMGTLVSLAISFWYREYEYSRWVPFLNGVILVFGATAVRTLYLFVLGRLRASGRDRLRLLVVGTGSSAKRAMEALQEHPELGYDIAGYLHADGAESPKSIDGRPVMGHIAVILPVIRQHQIQEVVIAPEPHDQVDISRLVRRCRSEGVGVKLVPDITGFILGDRELRCVDNLFWVDVESSISRRWQTAIKRLFDIVTSVLVLVLTFPLQVLIALAIRRDSSGPVIFKQQRTGENGKPFTIYKFRSMVTNAEELLPKLVDVARIPEPVFKIADDPRVTRLGRFLRRWSLDELPQFWNVLRGEMSVVGPRPEEIRIASLYDERASERLRVRPGITGFQQVNCRGTEDFSDRLRYDLYYLNNQGFFLDLLIILQTLWVVMTGKGRH
jgi:exopolysaccharide biosynthesis polyprenyl glycosylphosphotransferase